MTSLATALARAHQEQFPSSRHFEGNRSPFPTRQSVLQLMGPVPFPTFCAPFKAYMVPFTKRDGLPEYLAAWQPTVDAMMRDVDTNQVCFITIDCKDIQPGETHRRSGVHVDGYWSHDGCGHRAHISGKVSWADSSFSEKEALLLASNVTGCVAYTGTWTGLLHEGGDARDIEISHLTPVVLEGGFCYAGSAGLLHESIPQVHGALRALVRINVPGWSPASA